MPARRRCDSGARSATRCARATACGCSHARCGGCAAARRPSARRSPRWRSSSRSARAPSSPGPTPTSPTTGSTAASTRRPSGGAVRPAKVAEPLGLVEVSHRLAQHRGMRLGRARRGLEPDAAPRAGHREGTMASTSRPAVPTRTSTACTRASMRIAEGEGVLVEGIAYCDEHDISTFGNCLRGERAIVLEQARAVGRGRGARASSCCRRRRRHRSTGSTRWSASAESAPVAAIPTRWECLDEAIDLADGLDEQEWIVLVRTARAEACWLEGRSTRHSTSLPPPTGAATQRRRSSAATRGGLAAPHHRAASGESTGELIEPFATELAGDHRRAARAVGRPAAFATTPPLALLGSADEADLREALARLEALGADAALGSPANGCAGSACGRSRPASGRSTQGPPGRA